MMSIPSDGVQQSVRPGNAPVRGPATTSSEEMGHIMGSQFRFTYSWGS